MENKQEKRRYYVGGLYSEGMPLETQIERLFGSFKNYELKSFHTKDGNKNFAYVELEGTERDHMKVLNLNHQVFRGNEIRVEKAKESRLEKLSKEREEQKEKEKKEKETQEKEKQEKEQNKTHKNKQNQTGNTKDWIKVKGQLLPVLRLAKNNGKTFVHNPQQFAKNHQPLWGTQHEVSVNELWKIVNEPERLNKRRRDDEEQINHKKQKKEIEKQNNEEQIEKNEKKEAKTKESERPYLEFTEPKQNLNETSNEKNKKTKLDKLESKNLDSQEISKERKKNTNISEDNIYDLVTKSLQKEKQQAQKAKSLPKTDTKNMQSGEIDFEVVEVKPIKKKKLSSSSSSSSEQKKNLFKNNDSFFALKKTNAKIQIIPDVEIEPKKGSSSEDSMEVIKSQVSKTSLPKPQSKPGTGNVFKSTQTQPPSGDTPSLAITKNPQQIQKQSSEDPKKLLKRQVSPQNKKQPNESSEHSSSEELQKPQKTSPGQQTIHQSQKPPQSQQKPIQKTEHGSSSYYSSSSSGKKKPQQIVQPQKALQKPDNSSSYYSTSSGEEILQQRQEIQPPTKLQQPQPQQNQDLPRQPQKSQLPQRSQLPPQKPFQKPTHDSSSYYSYSSSDEKKTQIPQVQPKAQSLATSQKPQLSQKAHTQQRPQKLTSGSSSYYSSSSSEKKTHSQQSKVQPQQPTQKFQKQQTPLQKQLKPQNKIQQKLMKATSSSSGEGEEKPQKLHQPKSSDSSSYYYSSDLESGTATTPQIKKQADKFSFKLTETLEANKSDQINKEDENLEKMEVIEERTTPGYEVKATWEELVGFSDSEKDSEDEDFFLPTNTPLPPVDKDLPEEIEKVESEKLSLQQESIIPPPLFMFQEGTKQPDMSSDGHSQNLFLRQLTINGVEKEWREKIGPAKKFWVEKCKQARKKIK